jgi:hypothetical protein
MLLSGVDVCSIEREIVADFTAYKVLNGICAGV